MATTEHQRIAVERAVDHVLTVEDVFVHKLIARRPRDQDDINSILSTGLTFDGDTSNTGLGNGASKTAGVRLGPATEPSSRRVDYPPA